MRDFLDVAEDLLKRDRTGEYNEDFRRVLRARSRLQMTHSKFATVDILNVEDVFSAIEFSELLGLPLLDDEGDGLGLSMRRLIAKTIEQTSVFEIPDGRPVVPSGYEGLFRLFHCMQEELDYGERLAVISLNYDLQMEFARSLWLWKYLVSGVVVPAFKRMADWQSPYLSLLKLHGSVDWRWCPKCRRMPQDLPVEHFGRLLERESDRTDRYVADLQRNLNYQCDQCRGPVEVFVVPPVWNKTPHLEVLMPIWRQATVELGEAENIFVIGYSLPPTDYFFRLLLSLGTISESPLRRFWVFDPAPKEGAVDDRYQGLLGPATAKRYQYFKSTFERRDDSVWAIDIIREELGFQSWEEGWGLLPPPPPPSPSPISRSTPSRRR